MLQEALAAQVLLTQFSSDGGKAEKFWPAQTWWQRSGWEVVAELAADTYAHDVATLCRLINWLAAANPELAADVWRQVDQPALPETSLLAIKARWAPALTDQADQPSAEARAGIGRALAAWDLDHRPGIGLLPDGCPDIDWVVFSDVQPFVYQGRAHKGLPPFALSRYPITHRQFQAFVEAHDRYRHVSLPIGMAQRLGSPRDARWTDANVPRENVSWYEALAFCD